jgi:hypothetical protein
MEMNKDVKVYYKVINQMFIEYDKPISTENDFYGKHLQEVNETQLALFELITALDEKLNVGVDLYHSIWSNLAMLGGDYVDLIEKHEEDPILLSDLLHNEKHTEKIYKEQLFEIILDFKECLVGKNYNGQFSVPKPLFNGTRFWEYLFERMRKINFVDRISRMDSYFLFKNIEDCNHYMGLRQNMGKIVKVELLETKNIFESDMKLMDNIKNHYTIKRINENINNYWNKKYTHKPTIEVLFKGILKIVN